MPTRILAQATGKHDENPFGARGRRNVRQLGTALAADGPAHHSRLAGRKAAFICSGHFNAGRRPAELDGDELVRISPVYREALADLPAAARDKAR